MINISNGNYPDIFDEFDKIAEEAEDLHKVYINNTTNYVSNEKIPEYIAEIHELSGRESDPLGILDFFTEPINEFIRFINTIIELINACIFYSKCSFKLLVNLFTVPCIFWYLLNFFCIIVYFPFSFIFWLVGITDIIENYLWGPIYLIDEIVHDYTTFHIAHFPDSVINGCYRCPAKFQVLSFSAFKFIGDAFRDVMDVFSLFPKFNTQF
jgi:hypothetical protein